MVHETFVGLQGVAGQILLDPYNPASNFDLKEGKMNECKHML